MRRYPRELNGKPADHIALNDKDGKPDYLINPNKSMSIQLVAFDDIIQYVVDGKLVYQIRFGNTIFVERQDENGKTITEEKIYDRDQFPVYNEGYFGFRMVDTHHIYSNFKVYRLEPIK